MKSYRTLFKSLIMLAALMFFIPTAHADEWRALPDDNLAYPVLLVSETVRGQGTMGSGFYYNDSKAIYFITARHVLFSETFVKITTLPAELAVPYHLLYRLHYDGEKKELSFAGIMSEKDKTDLIGAASNQPLFKQAVEQLFKNSQTPQLKHQTATLFSYSKERGKGEDNEIQLQLLKLLSNGMIKSHRSSDIAAVKIGTITAQGEGKYDFTLSDGVAVMKGSGILGIDGTKNTKLFDEVLEGNAIFMFGYPVSISQSNAFLNVRLPLLRKGIVAGKNDTLKAIILDCPVYQGNSGGLVVEVDTKFPETRYKGIGLITDFVPFRNEKGQNAQNSGYSIAVPMDAIVELLKD